MPSRHPETRSSTSRASLEFFKGFLRNPREVGSVIPSSRFLTRRVMSHGGVRTARVIVELGPGTGVLTREMLRLMRPDAKLVAVEISKEFADLLRADITDPRLHVVQGSAAQLERALHVAGESQADLVVSGIPFSTMESGEGLATLTAAKHVLAPEGKFVAYQFRSAVRRLAEPVFGRPETHSGFWNIPPMRIYVWPARGRGIPQMSGTAAHAAPGLTATGDESSVGAGAPV
jgi:phosphatidylethanolamine/phosphatidyl-N-methylethanolamine N-methyltransferase